MATGQALYVLSDHSDAILRIDLSPDGKRLVTSSENGTAKVWDLEASAAASSGRELFTLSGHTRQESGFWKGVMDVAFSPDGERLATAAKDGLVKTWDVRTGEELLILGGHEAGVNSVTFSPDGRLMATASDDYTVRVWDAGTGRELWALSTEIDGWSVDFSPDGSRLVVGDSEGEIRVWQLPQNPGENPDAVPEELLTFLGNTGWIGTVRFSPDGARIVGGGINGLSLWDAESGELLLHLVDSGATYGASFSPDGTRLATAHRDGTARLFTLDPDELTTLARSRLTRPLTTQECQQYLHVDGCPPLP